MSHKSLVILNLLVLTGLSACSTLRDAGRLKHVPGVTLVDQNKNADPRMTFSVDSWVKDILDLDGSSRCSDFSVTENTQEKVGTVSRLTEFSAVNCFEKATAVADKAARRNDFIYQAMTVSDINCRARIDRIYSVESGGDTFFGTTQQLLGTGGALATDAATSRIASAISAATSSFWERSKSEFLAGAQMQTVITKVLEDRETKGKEIKSRMKTYSQTGTGTAARESVKLNSYDGYRLSEAVYDVIAYDDLCDLFK